MPAAEHVFELLDREVWAVTSGTLERPAGLLATWVMQAVLDPQRPMLLAGIAPNHHTASRIDGSGHLAAHLLRADQAPLGLRLAASSGHESNKLEGVPLRTAADDLPAPILEDCLAWVAGPVVARLDAGDRIFYWVDVVAAERLGDDAPLRQTGLLSAADEPTRQRLRADRQQDIERHRPLHQRLARRLAAGAAAMTQINEPASWLELSSAPMPWRPRSKTANSHTAFEARRNIITPPPP